jgi:hypothetical protein
MSKIEETYPGVHSVTNFTVGSGTLYGTDVVKSISRDEIVAVALSGSAGGIVYLEDSGDYRSNINSSTVRTIDIPNIYSGFVKNSYGAVYEYNGDMYVMSKDIGVTAWSIKVINVDDIVDFGEVGTSTSYSISDSYIGSVSSAQEILIYNDNTVMANANVVIAYSGRESDSYLEIALNEGGPYYSIYENNIGFPGTYPWSSGELLNVIILDDYVTTSGIEGPWTYTSPVIDTEVVTNYNSVRLFWETEENYLSSIDYKDYLNGKKSIMVRQSNTPPGGSWTSGELAPSDDALWSTISGTLEYEYAPNNSIDAITTRYAQFKVNFYPALNTGLLVGTDLTGASHYTTSSGVSNKLPKLYTLGVEIPLHVYGIYPNESKSMFVRSNIPEPVSGTRMLNTVRNGYLDVWWDLPVNE